MFEILKCGSLTTVQDAGRFGYRHLGIIQAGVMDPFALLQANLLLGNEPDAAVLEVSLGPMHVRFHDACAIVLMGADYRATLQHSAAAPRALMPGYVHRLPAGSVLKLGQPILPGMRTCIALQGGIDVPRVLGSRSTDITAGFGGYCGRPLQAGDCLETGPVANTSMTAPGHGVRTLTATHLLRATRGPDYDAFDHSAQLGFWEREWRIDSHSNRMGMRLNGSRLQLRQTLERNSCGVFPGVVQVPADGQPIVLGVDSQTVGGYPAIACVIHSDLWQMAYLPPGCKLLFREVTHMEAQRISRKCDQALRMLAQSIGRCSGQGD